MARVRNMEDLQKEIMKRMSDAMLDIAIDAESKVKAQLQKDVYNTYTPKDYQRTGGLMKSVDADVSSKGKHVSAQIFHNPKLMEAIKPYEGNNYIGQHYSTYPYSPMDYREFLAETVNYGIRDGKQKVFGDGVYARSRPYFDNARTIVEANFEKNMVKLLKRSGLKVV